MLRFPNDNCLHFWECCQWDAALVSKVSKYPLSPYDLNILRPYLPDDGDGKVSVCINSLEASGQMDVQSIGTAGYGAFWRFDPAPEQILTENHHEDVLPVQGLMKMRVPKSNYP